MARNLKLELSFISDLENGHAAIPSELKSSLVRIMHQADTNADQTQRTPIAEVIMKEKNLAQIHSFDCDFDVVTGVSYQTSLKARGHA